MSPKAPLEVTFWGVRGSLATPGRQTQKYGGNTSCIEVRAGDERIILDMGSGLRMLGQKLSAARGVRASVFLSHYHWDHILGLPFFTPAYHSDTRLVMYGATRGGKTVKEILAGQMINPYFPVSLEAMRAEMQFRTIASGDKVKVGDAVVRVRELAHPGGALGFRVERRGASMVYATDFEHGCGGDDALLELAEGTDLLVYDATYTVPEYGRHKGWGHSTWREGVKFAKAAGARRLVLFHHDPSHPDRVVERVETLAKAAFPGAEAAREGRTIRLAAHDRKAR